MEESNQIDTQEPVTMWHCRICGYATSKWHELRTHHRLEHPKHKDTENEQSEPTTEREAEREAELENDIAIDNAGITPAEFVLAWEQRLIEYRDMIEVLKRQVAERDNALTKEMDKNRKLVNELNDLRYRTKSWQDQLRATSAALSKP